MYRRLHDIPAQIPFWSFVQNFSWRGLRGDIREAIAGSDKDFTSVNLSKAWFWSRFLR